MSRRRAQPATLSGVSRRGDGDVRPGRAHAAGRDGRRLLPGLGRVSTAVPTASAAGRSERSAGDRLARAGAEMAPGPVAGLRALRPAGSRAGLATTAAFRMAGVVLRARRGGATPGGCDA